MTQNKPLTRQKTLKEFSELKPIDQKRIEIVASGIFQIAFKGEANDDFRPKAGTQVHRVWKMMKLDERQQIAWQMFCDTVFQAHGKSGKVGSGYGEYTDGSGVDFRIPIAYINVYQRKLEELLLRFLDRRERELLIDLLQDTLRGDSALDLETIGAILSGFKKDKEYARVAGVVHVQCLLNRLATFFQV